MVLNKLLFGEGLIYIELPRVEFTKCGLKKELSIWKWYSLKLKRGGNIFISKVLEKSHIMDCHVMFCCCFFSIQQTEPSGILNLLWIHKLKSPEGCFPFMYDLWKEMYTFKSRFLFFVLLLLFLRTTPKKSGGINH